MRDIDEFLRTITIFSDLTDEEIAIFLQWLGSRTIEKGEVLFHEGDPGDELFLVTSGKVAISVKLQDGQDLEISEISAGNFFGEMSIFDNSPRSATCYTKEESELLGLRAEDFFTLMTTHPSITTKIMYRMLRIIVERLQNTGKFLSDMVQFGEEARKRAVTDTFTGLFNRRFFDDALEEQFSRAKMGRSSLALVMVDLDHFGKLNDEYGEKVGDDVILEAVKVFKTVFSEKDILVRYGGDEFTFILPNRSSDTAWDLCDKVCRDLRSLTILENRDGTIRKVTSSIGIAAYPDHAMTKKQLLEKADGALYQAKEQGRDRAVVTCGILHDDE